MYIKHKDNEFNIQLDKKGSNIQIKGKLDNIYTLSVPYDLPHSELIQYLNIYAKKLISDYQKSLTNNKYQIIEIYNKQFFISTIKSQISNYRRGNIIYSSIPTKSIENRKKICKEVFSYDIRTLIGEWEERLGCIVENINIKSFKTKPFKVCHLNNTIDFSIRLTNRDFNYIEFIVAKSIFTLLKLDKITEERLMKQFVKEYKHNLRIFDYERSI